MSVLFLKCQTKQKNKIKKKQKQKKDNIVIRPRMCSMIQHHNFDDYGLLSQEMIANAKSFNLNFNTLKDTYESIIHILLNPIINIKQMYSLQHLISAWQSHDSSGVSF